MTALLKLFAILMIVFSAGCSGVKPAQNKSADLMYKEAMAYFDRGDYEDAIAGFQGLNAKYPASEYNIQSKLRIADSYYKGENYPEAISAYKEFEKLHPTNEEVAYAIFQTGMSYFNQMLTIDRDQTSTANAATEFERLLSRFPHTQYTDAAKKNLEAARSNLSGNEFFIASYYFKKKKYNAALERFEALRIKSPDFEAMDKLLFYSGRAYINISENDKGKALLEKLITDYPVSSYAIKAKKILDETRQ